MGKRTDASLAALAISGIVDWRIAHETSIVPGTHPADAENHVNGVEPISPFRYDDGHQRLPHCGPLFRPCDRLTEFPPCSPSLANQTVSGSVTAFRAAISS